LLENLKGSFKNHQSLFFYHQNHQKQEFFKLGSESVKKMGLTEPKVVTGPAGYVLEDVPHLSDYIPDLPVRFSLSLSSFFLKLLFMVND